MSWRIVSSREGGPQFIARPAKCAPEVRGRAVRVAWRSERPIAAVARDLGSHYETLRVWARQDEAGDGTRADWLASAEPEELVTLRREVRDLRKASEILKVASVFARELGQPRPR